VVAADAGLPQLDSIGGGASDADDFAGTIGGSPDIVLIDAARDGNGGLSPTALQAQHVVIVMQVSADAVADAYVCIKRLRVAHEIAEFRVIVNLLGGETAVGPPLAGLRDLARDYLAASVVTAGSIAADPCVPRAIELSRCAVDAFPASQAVSDFARIAADMQSWPGRTVASCRYAAKMHLDSQAVVRMSRFVTNHRAQKDVASNFLRG